MMKSRFLALVSVGLFAAGSAIAADKACCAKQASTEGKTECVSFANLNLSADQKAKLQTWQTECMKAGCTKESHKKFLQEAKGILSKEQFAAVKAECVKAGQKS